MIVRLNNMNIVVIGLGSMGRRRIRLIQKYNKMFNIIGVDVDGSRRNIASKELGIDTNDSLEQVINSREIDCAFVCSSPLSHNKLINRCLKSNMHVFTELNLVIDGYDENIELSKEKGKLLFLSSTFLFREEIRKINDIVKEQSGLVNYSYHIGQYLPDWHPWENYKDFFVGNNRTNGCREIFAIELPWLINTFGEIKDIVVKKDKISSLEIGYNDNYILIVEHISGHKGMLAVDVISRKAVRNLEVYGEKIYLSWDGSPQGLNVINIETKSEENIVLYDNVEQLKEYSSFVIENAYYNEICSFFDGIKNNSNLIYGFEKDKIILELIDRIEA